MSPAFVVRLALVTLIAVIVGVIMGMTALQESERASELHEAAQVCLSQGRQLGEIRFGEAEEAEQFKCRR